MALLHEEKTEKNKICKKVYFFSVASVYQHFFYVKFSILSWSVDWLTSKVRGVIGAAVQNMPNIFTSATDMYSICKVVWM